MVWQMVYDGEGGYDPAGVLAEPAQLQSHPAAPAVPSSASASPAVTAASHSSLRSVYPYDSPDHLHIRETKIHR